MLFHLKNLLFWDAFKTSLCFSALSLFFSAENTRSWQYKKRVGICAESTNDIAEESSLTVLR